MSAVHKVFLITFIFSRCGKSVWHECRGLWFSINHAMFFAKQSEISKIGCFPCCSLGSCFFCRSERQKCWSSCYRQWNFNLIMCVFIWYTCLHWQLITTGHLVTVQICWPQSTLLKIFSFCSESKVKGRYTAAVLFQESHFDTKRGSCAVKKLPHFFFID